MHISDASSERGIHSRASDMGGSAKARGGVLSRVVPPRIDEQKAGKAGATGTGAGAK